MNKKLHFKSLILLCALIVGSVSAWADEVTFNFPSIASSNNWESGEAYTSVEITPITITAKGGGNNGKYYSSNGGSWRMYSGGTVEITASDGYTITRVSSNPEKSFTITNGVATFSPSARTDFVSITVTYTTSGGGTPIPTTYTVTYDANEGTGTITDSNSPYEAGTTVTVLDNTFTRDGYTFTKWNTAADGSGTDYDEGATFTISANTTLYAQWEEQNDGNIQWVLTNLANLTSEDVFVIVGNNNYAITNDKGTGSAPATVGVTIEGSTITSDVTANIQWTVSGDATNGYTFYPKGSTTTWLYCNTTAATGSNNNMRVGTGERKVFALNSNNYLLTNDDETTRYLSIYNDNDWRGYTNTNLCPTISFYKKVTDGVVPPSISADNVSLEYDATTGSISYTINNAVVGGSLTASTEASWLTLGTVSGSTITFTCSANETKTERTATATLTYTYNTDQTVTKTVTITQAGNPNVIDKISDITAVDAAYSVIGTVVATNSRGFVIGDGTGYVYTYLNTVPTYTVGDNVSVSGKTGTYGRILQFTNTATIDDSETSSYNKTPTVKVIDAAAIAEYNKDYQLSDYVQFEGTLTKSDNYYNVTVGTASATTGGTASARISYPTEAQITTLNGLLNKKVRVKGYFAGFSNSNTIFTAMLESVEEIIVPTIAVTPTSPTGFIYEENDGPSEAQTFTVSGANLTGDITVSLDESSNFEISSDDATYGSSLTLSSSATNSTLFVRLKAGLAISDDYRGTITLTSAGADNVEVNLSGSVVEKPSLSFDFTDTAWGFPADYEKAEKTYTNGGYTFTVGAVTEGGHKALISNSKQVALIFGKESGASITFPAFNFKVKKIKVYGNGTASESVTFNIFVEDDAVSREVTSSKVTQTFEIAEANQSAGTIYTLKVTNAINCQISKIDIIGDAVSVTIPESKYTTFASSDAVDFKDTGVTICVVKVDNNVAKLTPIRGTIVPANTGVILTAENAGSYAGVITTEEGSLDGNEMVGITTETVVAYNVGDKYNYILQGGKFKKATGDKLKAGKAYLSTTYNVAATGARELKIVFDGETTGIKAIETANDKSVYDLQGRKVSAPTKGLYIINGKKMIVK